MKPEAIIVINSVLTKAVYALYPLLLIYLAASHLTDKQPGFVPAVLVPGISFVLLSIFRDKINAPRPYELYDIDPIIVTDPPAAIAFVISPEYLIPPSAIIGIPCFFAAS